MARGSFFIGGYKLFIKMLVPPIVSCAKYSNQAAYCITDDEDKKSKIKYFHILFLLLDKIFILDLCVLDIFANEDIFPDISKQLFHC